MLSLAQITPGNRQPRERYSVRFIEIDPKKLLENEPARVGGKFEGTKRLDVTRFCKNDGERKVIVFTFEKGKVPKFNFISIYNGQDVPSHERKNWTCDETERKLEDDEAFKKKCESWGAKPHELAEAIVSFAHR